MALIYYMPIWNIRIESSRESIYADTHTHIHVYIIYIYTHIVSFYSILWSIFLPDLDALATPTTPSTPKFQYGAMAPPPAFPPPQGPQPQPKQAMLVRVQTPSGVQSRVVSPNGVRRGAAVSSQWFSEYGLGTVSIQDTIFRLLPDNFIRDAIPMPTQWFDNVTEKKKPSEWVAVQFSKVQLGQRIEMWKKLKFSCMKLLISPVSCRVSLKPIHVRWFYMTHCSTVLPVCLTVSYSIYISLSNKMVEMMRWSPWYINDIWYIPWYCDDQNDCGFII